MTTRYDDDIVIGPEGSLTFAAGATLILPDETTVVGGYESFTANGTVADDTTLALVDTTSGNVTVTLPPLADVASDRVFRFVKSVAANSMIVDGNGAETIEGSANVTRTNQNAFVAVRKVGSAWALDGNLKGNTNLAELSSPATARTNLGIHQVLNFPSVNVQASGADVQYYVHPTGAPDAVITALNSRLNGGALATGDATITAAINGSGVTNGVITITQSGSAAGDLDSASPTAARTISAGQVLSLTVGGSNTAARTAAVSVRMTY